MTEFVIVVCTVAVLVTILLTRPSEYFNMEELMSELTAAVEALTDGVKKHAEVQAAAIERVRQDVANYVAQVEQGQGAGTEAKAAAANINASLVLLSQSTDILANLDPDPSNPVVPPPPTPDPEPTPVPPSDSSTQPDGPVTP